MITSEGINGAWLKILKELKEEGNDVSPRGQGSIELKNVSVEIKNPKKRILSNPIRKMSLPFAFGELMWYLTARNDLEMMSYYSNIMKRFSDDGESLNSAYGYRIFGLHPQIGFNQWQFVIDKLKSDEQSRQAIIHLHTPNNVKTNDEVCTLSLQFMIRDGKLDMFVNMRSNDIIWGFTYDVFAFTSFQELIANELELELGSYFHNAASMHIYEKDYDQLEHVNNLYDQLYYMAKYDKEFSYEGLTIHDRDFQLLVSAEKEFRTLVNVNIDTTDDFVKSFKQMITRESVKSIVDIFNIYYVKKREGIEAANKLLSYDNIFHCMMRNYMSGKKLINSDLTIVDGCDGAGKTTFIDDTVKRHEDLMKISFPKPGKNFDTLVYFQTALMTGDIILDRFFHSDLVYSVFYERDRLVSWDEVLSVLEPILNYRGASYIFMNTNHEICFDRLDEKDRGSFSKQNVTRLCDIYNTIYNASNLKLKDKFY